MKNIEIFKDIMCDDIRPVLIYNNADSLLYWNNYEAEKAHLNYVSLREIKSDQSGKCQYTSGGFRFVGNMYKEMFEGYTVVIFRADAARSFFASKAFLEYSKDCSEVIRRSVTGISFCVDMLNEATDESCKEKELVTNYLDSIIKNAHQLMRIEENNRRLRDISNPLEDMRYYDFKNLMSKIVEESQKALPDGKIISFVTNDECMIRVNRSLFTFFIVNVIRFSFLFSSSDIIEMKSERIENEISVKIFADFNFTINEDVFNDEYYIMRLEAEKMNIKIKFPDSTSNDNCLLLIIPHHVRGDMMLHSSESLRDNYTYGLFSIYNVMLGDITKKDSHF